MQQNKLRIIIHAIAPCTEEETLISCELIPEHVLQPKCVHKNNTKE